MILIPFTYDHISIEQLDPHYPTPIAIILEFISTIDVALFEVSKVRYTLWNFSTGSTSMIWTLFDFNATAIHPASVYILEGSKFTNSIVEL